MTIQRGGKRRRWPYRQPVDHRFDAGDSHTYTVDDARFEVVAGQLKLKATDSLNHESEPTVDVTVTSTDGGGLTTNQLFTITVTDVNETPTATNLTSTSVYNEGDASRCDHGHRGQRCGYG